MSFEPLKEEREKELMERMAQIVVNRKMQAPAILFLETIKPLSFLGSQMTLFTLSPFLSLLAEYEGTAQDAIRYFEKRENVELLIQRIEALTEERDTLRLEQHVAGKADTPGRFRSFLRRLLD